jgi:hypothetical protein
MFLVHILYQNNGAHVFWCFDWMPGTMPKGEGDVYLSEIRILERRFCRYPYSAAHYCDKLSLESAIPAVFIVV